MCSRWSPLSLSLKARRPQPGIGVGFSASTLDGPATVHIGDSAANWACGRASRMIGARQSLPPMLAALALVGCGSATKPSASATRTATATTSGSGAEEVPPVTAQSAYDSVAPAVKRLIAADKRTRASPSDPAVWSAVAAAGKKVSAAAGKFEPADVADQQMRLARAADTVASYATKVQTELASGNNAAADAARTAYEENYTRKFEPALRSWLSGLEAAGVHF